MHEECKAECFLIAYLRFANNDLVFVTSESDVADITMRRAI